MSRRTPALSRPIAGVSSLAVALALAGTAATVGAMPATAADRTADLEVPAGTWHYKVALDDAWDESYGGDGGTGDTPLVVAGPSTVRFTYDDTTHRTALAPLDLAGDAGPADDAIVAPPVRDPGAG